MSDRRPLRIPAIRNLLYSEKISILIKAVVKESNKYVYENYKINVDSKKASVSAGFLVG